MMLLCYWWCCFLYFWYFLLWRPTAWCLLTLFFRLWRNGSDRCTLSLPTPPPPFPTLKTNYDRRRSRRRARKWSLNTNNIDRYLLVSILVSILVLIFWYFKNNVFAKTWFSKACPEKSSKLSFLKSHSGQQYLRNTVASDTSHGLYPVKCHD